MPPEPRAALRMKSCARSTAAAAIPAQTDDQHRWATGVIVCAWILSYGIGEDLLRGALEVQLEAGAAGAAHAERLPCESGLQRVVVPGDGQHHLIGSGGVVGAAGDGDDAVRLGAVGNHRRVAHQRDLGAVALHRGRAEADVSAVLAFRGRRRQQQLFGRDAAHQPFVPAAARAVADQARDLGLMHREDHPGRGAGAAERVAHVGHLGDRRAVAAELDRDLGAQKPLLARRVDGLPREARLAVDRFGLRRRSLGDGGRPLLERGAVGREWYSAAFRGEVAELDFLHVHGPKPPI